MNLNMQPDLILPEEGALRALLPKLMGRAFHVTKAEFFDSILHASAILPNQDGILATAFGSSSNSYFRNRGYVSVFDYRSPPADKFDLLMDRCSPIQAASPGGPIVVFFLNDQAADRLVSWDASKVDGRSDEMVLPYLEAGFLGPIPLAEIDGVLKVTIEQSLDSLASILRRGRQNAC